MDDLTMDTGITDAEFTDIGSPEVGTDVSTEVSTPDATGDTGVEPSTALATTGDTRLTTAPGKLSEAATTALATIKGTNPAIAAELTKAIHIRDAVRAEFPGGLKEARELKARLADLESDGPIEQTREELAGFREYDNQFMTGDPRFVETMIKAEPNAFQRLAPMIMQKFAELNPDGFKSLTAKATIQDMSEQRFIMSMDLCSYALTDLARALGDNPSAAALHGRCVDLFNSLVTYVQKMDESAKKPIALPESKAVTTEPDKNASAIQELWNTDTDKILGKMYNDEFARLTNGRRFTAEQKADIQERFLMRLDKAMKGTPNMAERIKQYFTAGDREGNKRFISSIYSQKVPAIMSALIRPAGAPATTAKTVTGTAAVATGTDNKGWQRIAAMPKPNEISPQSDIRMIEQNRAILRDGRRVTWA